MIFSNSSCIVTQLGDTTTSEPRLIVMRIGVNFDESDQKTVKIKQLLRLDFSSFHHSQQLPIVLS